MGAKREHHLEDGEAQARRSLEHAGRRWSSNPNTYYVLLVVVLLLILLVAI